MQVAGHCGKCGAPYYVPTIWHGITPPPATPSCGCWSGQRTAVTDHTYKIELEPSPDVKEVAARVHESYQKQVKALCDERDRLRKIVDTIRDIIGDELVIYELEAAITNCDPDKYDHPDDKEYCEQMRPHLEAALEHFSEAA